MEPATIGRWTDHSFFLISVTFRGPLLVIVQVQQDETPAQEGRDALRPLEANLENSIDRGCEDHLVQQMSSCSQQPHRDFDGWQRGCLEDKLLARGVIRAVVRLTGNPQINYAAQGQPPDHASP